MLPPRHVIRSARRLADLSQRELAELAGVSQSTIARIETGKRKPSLELLTTLLEVTGCKLIAQPEDDTQTLPLIVDDDMRDRARRRYPAHLDVIYGRRTQFRPLRPSTVKGRYFRSRRVRDIRRKRGWKDPRVDTDWLPPES